FQSTNPQTCALVDTPKRLTIQMRPPQKPNRPRAQATPTSDAIAVPVCGRFARLLSRLLRPHPERAFDGVRTHTEFGNIAGSSEMGREGIEPSTLGLRVGPWRLG